MINICIPDEFIERFPTIKWGSVAERAMKDEYMRLSDCVCSDDRDHMEINHRVRKIVHGCGFDHDISGIRNHIELQIGRKILTGTDLGKN